MSTLPARFLVGIDWATQSHQVCVLDASLGRVLFHKAIDHSGQAIALLVTDLLALAPGQPEQIAIAIETPHGALVEALVEHGLAVFSLNPRQMDRFRDRYSVAGAKSDRQDAFVLADSLRTDAALFRRVQLDEPRLLRLRELSRTEDRLTQEQVRAGNQLRDLLWRYFPTLLALCPSLDEPWFWDLLELAPLPAQAARLRRPTLSALLQQHRIRRFSAAEVRDKLQSLPLPVAPGVAEACSEHALLLVGQLRLLHQQRRQTAARMQDLMDQIHSGPEEPEPAAATLSRDLQILQSLPGVGRIVAATLLSEAPQLLAERNYAALRAYAGTAPVTRQSGKHRQVQMRSSCNERLRHAVYHWSRGSMQREERSRQHYARLRARSHSHGRALRGVADRLLAMLIAMLEAGTVYDPSRRTVPATTAEQPGAGVRPSTEKP